jgi:hypothetical protein
MQYIVIIDMSMIFEHSQTKFVTFITLTPPFFCLCISLSLSLSLYIYIYIYIYICSLAVLFSSQSTAHFLIWWNCSFGNIERVHSVHLNSLKPRGKIER